MLVARGYNFACVIKRSNCTTVPRRLSVIVDSRPCGEYCCDFRGVCVSLWTPAPVPVCSWFPVLPLTW